MRSRFESWLTPQRLLRTSIGVALATILLKTLAWHVTGSVGLLSDAMEAFVNLAGAVFALCMVSVAQQPPDDGHPYGHYKAEYFSSGFEGVLVVGAGLGILWAAVQRLFDPQPLTSPGWGMLLAAFSALLNGLLAWAMLHASRRHRSVALEADARHLLSDVWTTLGVLAGVLAVLLTGWAWLDAAVAMAVALHILWVGARLVWQASQGLMDGALDGAALAAMQAVLARYAQQHPQVRCDHVATRRAGERSFADLHLHVPAQWPLARAAALRGEIEQALMQAVPGLRARIELLPSNEEDRATQAAERAYAAHTADAADSADRADTANQRTNP